MSLTARHEYILITDRFTTEATLTLQKNINCTIIQTDHAPKPEELNKATVLLIRSRTNINKKLIDQAPHLKVIITATSGYDHIDIAYAYLKNIQVMYTPDANTESAAELTLFLMLAALRRATEVARHLKNGMWKDQLTLGHELRGKSVGLIGLGRVGSRVAQLLLGFGATPLAYDPYQDDENFKKLDIPRLGLSEVFSQSDIISFHVPLTTETRQMVRAETLGLMPTGVILINTSRGPVFDERALVTALESGEVAGAGLDVFENEPLARESRLRKLPNVVLTPHIGAYTEQAFARASKLAAEKCIAFLTSGETSDLIPK